MQQCAIMAHIEGGGAVRKLAIALTALGQRKIEERWP